ncbi:MAG: peptide deformylase [Gemmatimonadota bacterium]|nr:MAG: peptide deformylase [Gemmatimonadota bacterium]
MPVLEIRLYGDAVLREKAVPIRTIDDDVRALASDMLETVAEAEGVGLAGPQIGVSRRIIVVHPPNFEEDGERESPSVYVNPEIVQRAGPQESAEEGCLSIPGIYEQVKRPRHVRVRALDLDGKTVEFDAEGMLGRIFQHEIDHLDGVLFVDKIGPMRRALLKKQLRAFLE